MSERDEHAGRLGLLITRLAREKRRFMRKYLEGQGIGSLYALLLVLDAKPGSCQDFLCEHFCTDKSNLARDIMKLEKLRLIERKCDPNDRRRMNIFLSESGRTYLPVIRAGLLEWANGVTTGIGDEELTTVVTMLEKMV